MSYTYGSSTSVLTTDEPMPSAKREEKRGVVYTKPWVVELMLDLAGYTADRDLGGARAVEPAAGAGGFLVSMVERLLRSCAEHGREIVACSSALAAFDLDPVAVETCRANVSTVLAAHGVGPVDAERLVSAWVRHADYLLAAAQPAQADFVIGNPPYIRLEDVDAATAAAYRGRFRTMVGRADVYVAFFEAALKQLKTGGVCAFICADRWMLNQYGAELRRLVTSGFAVETVIELHRADAFENEVSAYPAITVIRRAEQGGAVVARAEAGVERLGSSAIRSVLAQAIGSSPMDGTRRVLSAARVDGWFEDDAPWPCSSPARLALLKRLESEFYPLESVGTATKVSIGVATGADDIFIRPTGSRRHFPKSAWLQRPLPRSGIDLDSAPRPYGSGAECLFATTFGLMRRRGRGTPPRFRQAGLDDESAPLPRMGGDALEVQIGARTAAPDRSSALVRHHDDGLPCISPPACRRTSQEFRLKRNPARD